MTLGPDLLQPHLRKLSLSGQQKHNNQDVDKPPTKRTRKESTSVAKLFRNLSPSVRTVLKRCTFSCLLLGYFIFLIYGGPVIIILTTLATQIKCFQEIISIAYKKYEVKDIPEFRYISAYFLVSANFYFGCENVSEYFNPFLNGAPYVRSLVVHYRFAAFCMYFVGVIWFVLTLKKRFYRKQFALLAWTHIILLVVVVQSHLIVKTIFQGMIWFIICITTVTCNDIMAYVFGKFFGRTPLIQLSPKKTWEGFVGAAVSTVVISCVVAYYLCGNEYFVCPIEYRQVGYEVIKMTQCEPDDLFRLATYNLDLVKVKMYPFVLHTFWLSIFGSIVAPFGGFFASGFKRAFNVKDFGDTIPGHGGIMDRFDCQLVMVTFVNVYITSFVGKGVDSEKNHVFERILGMSNVDQLEVYYMLKGTLVANGYRL